MLIRVWKKIRVRGDRPPPPFPTLTPAGCICSIRLPTRLPRALVFPNFSISQRLPPGPPALLDQVTPACPPLSSKGGSDTAVLISRTFLAPSSAAGGKSWLKPGEKVPESQSVATQGPRRHLSQSDLVKPKHPFSLRL